MRKLVIIPFVFITFSLFAAPIGEKRAREIASKFFESSATRSSAVVLDMEWAGSDLESATPNNATRSAVGNSEDMDEALVYIYNRVDTKGFVAIAGDDSVAEPILACSLNNRFDTQDMPDGAKAILQAWCEQIADARAENNIQTTATFASTTGIGNVVCSYETATWGQSAPFNGKSPTHNGKKTPSGCVATAVGIICKYWEWPLSGEGTTPEYSYTDDNGNPRTIYENKLGHSYDYSLLKMEYASSYTKAEGDMVATLLYDLACACYMKFGEDGSGANSKNATRAMMDHFKYSKGALYLYHAGRSEKEWDTMLQENMKTYGPMLFRGNSEKSGHAFVLDGYTDKRYFHINYGWNGNSNGYYLLPNISYYKNQAAAFYLEPDRDGTSTYRDYLTLTSATSSSGAVYRGIYTKEVEYKVGQQFSMPFRITNQGLGPYSGKYCVAHCDKDGKIKEILWEKDRSESNLSSSASNSGTWKLTINEEIELGDRLRVFYMSENTDNWERVFRDPNSETSHDEVILKATPAEVAKMLQLSYNKESKTFTFTSENAIQYSVKRAEGGDVHSGAVPSFTSTEIDMSMCESGKYTFSFASGGEPYTLSVIL